MQKDKPGSPLISCATLYEQLHDDDLLIFDAGFFLPRQQRDARSEYVQGHIPGALFFDIDQIADPDNALPHTLPDIQVFTRHMQDLGLQQHSRVVVYDNNAYFAAARAWWMLRVFGHDKVSVLDGGFRRWQQLSLPVQRTIPEPRSSVYTARFHPELLCRLQQVQDIYRTQSRQIVDARSADSFNGTRPLQDKNLQAGHIPHSINVPYRRLYDAQSHVLHTPEKLQTVLQEAQIDLNKAVLCTCGSGVSAALLALAFYRIGLTEVAVYDGSWAEWGRHRDTAKQIVS